MYSHTSQHFNISTTDAHLLTISRTTTLVSLHCPSDHCAADSAPQSAAAAGQTENLYKRVGDPSFQILLMKKILPGLLGLAAVLAITVAFAFSTVEKSKAKLFTQEWFTLNNGGDPKEPTDYTYLGSTPGCTDGLDVCAIRAEVQMIGEQQRPVIDGTLSDEIDDALVSHFESTNVKLKN